MSVVEIERREFLQFYWAHRYFPGDHVTFVAPTDWGKTTFTHELLQYTVSPELPVINLALKPKDEVMTEWTKRMGYRMTRNWPPLIVPYFKPLGWTCWPEHTYDPDVDDEWLAKVARRVLVHSYRKGKRVINADELGALEELGLNKVVRGIYRRGRSNGCGMWAGLQKPTHGETHAYGQARHLFLGNDPDKRSRDRFGEIGGVDPRMVADIVMGLEDHTWLYLGRRGRVMAIVGP